MRQRANNGPVDEIGMPVRSWDVVIGAIWAVAHAVWVADEVSQWSGQERETRPGKGPGSDVVSRAYVCVGGSFLALSSATAGYAGCYGR